MSRNGGTLDQGAERRHGFLMPPLRFPPRFLDTLHRFFMLLHRFIMPLRLFFMPLRRFLMPPLRRFLMPPLRFPLRFLETLHRFFVSFLRFRTPQLRGHHRFPMPFLRRRHHFRMPHLRGRHRFPMPPIRSPLQFRMPPILLPAPKVELPATFLRCPLHLSQTAPDKQALSKPNDQGSRRAENLPYLHRFEHDHDVGRFLRREPLLYHTFP